jgi:predicted transcriptional regulator
MTVNLKPETEPRLRELVASTGRPADDLVEDALAGYLAEVAQLRGLLDRHLDDIESGRVAPIDGPAAFSAIRETVRNAHRK